MKKVFLDTNFLLDLLVRDEEFRVNAKCVLEKCLQLDLEMSISFLSIANFAYIMRKDDLVHLKKNIKLICKLFSVIPNTKDQIIKAVEIETRDYEDALQYETALSYGCDCIITRNKKDFKFSNLSLFTPEEFLSQCN